MTASISTATVTTVPVNTILTAYHAAWSNDMKPNRYPVQRKFQWLRNGVPISYAVGTAYTTQPGDIGAAISLKENAWYLNETNPGTLVEVPIATAQAVSSSIVVTGSPDNELVYQDNLTYVGSFRLTSPPASSNQQSLSYGGHGLTINPNGYSGQRTMLSVGHPGLSYAGELSIPALGQTLDPAQLPASTLVRPATALVDPTEGQLFSSGIAGGTVAESWGLQIIPGSDKMLVTGLNWYSQNTYNVFWRRPADLTTQNQVDGPFVVIDPGNQENPRWTAGWMCDIPPNYQADLGGNMLASLTGISIRSSASNGPAAISFDTADIDSALATQHAGVAQGGSEKTITLAADASATTGTYVGQYIYVPSAAIEPRIITDYDGTTKQATIAPIGGTYWDISAPINGHSYKTTPVVSGNQLVGYSLENVIQAPALFNQVWNASSPRGMCIPNGTRSLLFFGAHGEGPNSYGDPGGISGDGFKIYDPDGPVKGYHAYPYTTKIWAYDINDLVSVKNGDKTYDQIQPYAVWSAVLPGKDSYTTAEVQGATYDPSSRRVYISQKVVDNYQGSGNYGALVVHAFEVTNAIAAPGISTTSLGPLVAGSAYSATLSATGADPITWSIVEGSLPAGLTLNASTGDITGTPETDAVISIKVRATNSAGFEEKTLVSGQTLAGILVEVARVTNGVAGSFQSLGSLVQMTTWVDGSYSQDFWRSGTAIDDTVFVITKEQTTDRAEVWIYRPPANSFRPANSSAFDYSWNTVTASDVENDKTYDIRISINGSLVTPQYSSSTTTRVLCAPGTIRRLVTSFKPWSWSRVDAGVSLYRLPSYNVNSLAEIVTASSLPNAASTLGSTPQESFSHSALGGQSSANWFDGNHSPSAGGSQAGRSLSQSYEAMAISDRVNNIATNLSDYENVLRKSAEYSGTFPQYTFLDPQTLRPYDAQKGSNPWSVMSAAYNCAGSTYVPMRTGFNWDTAHHYNNGHVAFEATRDPFYALLLQCNAMAALAEPSSAVRTGETKRFNPNSPIDNNGGVICPLPKYVIPVDQERSRWWSLAAITKAKLSTDLCPLIDFLQPSSMWDTVLDDGADMLYHYMSEIDAVTAAPARVTNGTEALQAQRYAQKTISAYDQLFSDYETGINQTPVPPPPVDVVDVLDTGVRYIGNSPGITSGYFSGGVTIPTLMQTAVSTQIISQSVTLAGLQATAYLPALTYVSTGYGAFEISINGGAFATGEQAVTNGDTLRVRLTTSASYAAVGTVTVVFRTTSGGADNYLLSFSYQNINNDRTPQTFQVGPNRAYTQLYSVLPLLRAGDTVEIDSGTYGPTAYNGTLNALNQTIEYTLAGETTMGFSIISTAGVGTITFEKFVSGSWTAMIVSGASTDTEWVSTGTYVCRAGLISTNSSNYTGATKIRMRLSSYTSGTFKAAINFQYSSLGAHTLTRSGTQELPITIKAAPGATTRPIITNGSLPDGTPGSYWYGMWVRAGSDVNFQGLEFVTDKCSSGIVTGAGTGSCTHRVSFIDCVMRDNSDGLLAFDTGSGSITLDRCWVNNNGDGVYPTYKAHGVYFGGNPDAFPDMVVTVKNCVFTNNEANSIKCRSPARIYDNWIAVPDNVNSNYCIELPGLQGPNTEGAHQNYADVCGNVLISQTANLLRVGGDGASARTNAKIRYYKNTCVITGSYYTAIRIADAMYSMLFSSNSFIGASGDALSNITLAGEQSAVTWASGINLRFEYNNLPAGYTVSNNASWTSVAQLASNTDGGTVSNNTFAAFDATPGGSLVGAGLTPPGTLPAGFSLPAGTFRIDFSTRVWTTQPTLYSVLTVPSRSSLTNIGAI